MSDEQNENIEIPSADDVLKKTLYPDEYRPTASNDDAETTETPEAPAMASAEVVQMLASVTFGIVAARRGEHWNLSAEEAQALGEAGGAVMDKYMPDAHAGPELALVAVGAMIVLPRLTADKKTGGDDGGKDQRQVAE